MGYSIAVHAKNKKLHEKMLKFMDKESKTIIDLFGEQKHNYCSRLKKDLSYCDGKLIIGCDYGGAGIEREYTYQICYWIAWKIGKKNLGKTIGFLLVTLIVSIPFLIISLQIELTVTINGATTTETFQLVPAPIPDVINSLVYIPIITLALGYLYLRVLDKRKQ